MEIKLCLGTAQFGLNYGINNPRGKIPAREIIDILNYARKNSITMLDTASAYGNSESVLGDAFSQTENVFDVITKYPANNEISPIKWIDTSLKFLKSKKVYGYLFHNYSIFENCPNYIDDFLQIKESGKSEKIGFSLYYPSEAEYILKNNIPCDIVQIPYNIFDQRFAYLLKELINQNIEIHIRSVFLQGLFFIEPEKLNIRFSSVKEKMRDINKLTNDLSLNIAALCLSFAGSNSDISFIVIGINSLDDLIENISVCELLKEKNIDNKIFEKFAVNDENIILPFNWL